MNCSSSRENWSITFNHAALEWVVSGWTCKCQGDVQVQGKQHQVMSAYNLAPTFPGQDGGDSYSSHGSLSRSNGELGTLQGSALTSECCTRRYASPETPAQTGHMTATRTPSATTWATTATPCTAASASLATPATASSAGRTQTWTAGPTRTCCAWPMQLTTAER